MKNQGPRMPSILYPYDMPANCGSNYDVFVYLRPETNGVETESALLRVINNNPVYKKDITLAYLANMPGDFIVTNHIIEHHYATKILFARQGRNAMTYSMNQTFKDHFGIDPNEVKILGSFEAMHALNKSWKDLFDIWVPEEDILKINGQIIKRVGDLFVINYDIPALLHKNNNNTDIAVMLFRSPLPYDAFEEIIKEMKEELEKQGIIQKGMPLSRIFHHSRGPFEQVLDAESYLYAPDGTQISIRKTSFSRYMIQKGFSAKQLKSILHFPICLFEKNTGEFIETDIFSYTIGDSYDQALKKFLAIKAQMIAQTRQNIRSSIPVISINKSL